MGWGGVMKKIGLVGLALAVPAGMIAIDSGLAADSPTKSYGKDSVNCRAPDAPYKNYDCLDKYLGDGFFERMVNYYRLEWGHEAAPSDPKAPPARREGWPAQPQTTPPMPFTEWPYGGATPIGVTAAEFDRQPVDGGDRPTPTLGKWMNDNHIQVYGWIDPGFNISNQHAHAGRQRAGRLRLHAQHAAARSGRHLRRARARHGADGPLRLGLPPLRRSTAKPIATRRRTASRAISC